MSISGAFQEHFRISSVAVQEQFRSSSEQFSSIDIKYYIGLRLHTIDKFKVSQYCSIKKTPKEKAFPIAVSGARELVLLKIKDKD